MEEKLIWQPFGLYTPSYEFGILLEPSFAQEMFSARLSQDKRQKIQQFAGEQIRSARYRHFEPYLFHEQTCFVRQFNIDGSAGKWLSIDGLYGRKPGFDKLIKYSSHNLNCAQDAYALMKLVDLWVEYAQIIK